MTTYRKNGTPKGPWPKRKRRPVLDRVMEKVVLNGGEDECWIFEGSRLWKQRGGGYGRISIEVGLEDYTHRVVYEAFVGPIPEGLHLHHLCETPACCNPAHLEPLTPKEHVATQNRPHYLKNKTHCRNGHDLSDAYHYKSGRIVCRACAKLSNAEGYKRRQKKLASQRVNIAPMSAPRNRMTRVSTPDPERSAP